MRNSIIHISWGGSIYRMRYLKRDYLIEMHRYCGPVIVKKDYGQHHFQPGYVIDEFMRRYNDKKSGLELVED